MGWHLILLLAVVQGVAEFLPISSSGHLRVLEAIFGVEGTLTLFDVMLHVGTLVAVVWVYRALVWRITRATLAALQRPGQLHRAFSEDEDFRALVLVLIGTVPTAIVAVVLGPVFEGGARVACAKAPAKYP